jgi:glycosyltransferase involved in cell wall biosynthesis
MHIAYNGWFWDQPDTGSGQYLRRLLGGLRRVAPDLKMTLVLPPKLDWADDLPDNVSIITTRGSRGNLGKVWFEQRTFPRMAARVQAHAAHVPYWGTPLSSPVPLITTVLDVIPLILPQYAPGLRGRLYTSLVSATARGSAGVITISEAAKAGVAEHLQIAPESITTTYLAADDAYHPRIGVERDDEVRAKYELPPRFVLYLGGFDLRKSVNQALLAHTYVRQAEGDDVPLVLAGREPAWGSPLFPDLRVYARELGIADGLRWIGRVDEADKPSLYRLASVFVYPSRYEGFGLPVVEAMACGTPVVANDIPVMSEIVGEGAFLTTAGDARSMAGAIIALLEQEPLRQTQITRGLSQATRYSWRKTARDTLAVYERVLRAQTKTAAGR